MKGKILAIILLLNFTSLALSAQWAKTFGTVEDDYTFCIKQTNDDGYIIAGATEFFGIDNTYHFDFWILKLTSDGAVEWQKTYGRDRDDFAYSILQTIDGGYIIGGRILIYGLGRNIWALKLSSNGNVEWQKCFGELSQAEASSIQQTSDGGYIIAGNIWPFEASQSEFWVLKLDSRGAVEWNESYGGFKDEIARFIYQTSDGGYIILGNTNSFGAGDSDIWILKLASDGTIEWQKTYGGSESEGASSIQQTNDGGYIVAGNIFSFGAGSADFWVLKITSEGEIDWNKTYGGSKNETAYSIQQSFDGGFIVAGETNSFGAGNKDIWILKLNILGDIEWQKTYGGSQDEEASFIQQTHDGGYIVAGSTNTYGVGKRDFLILKLFSNGDISSSCTFINESNAEVSDTDISPADTYIDPEIQEIQHYDLDVTSRESEALVFSLCSGQLSLSISTSNGGTTIPQPGTYTYDYAERINVSANPDLGYRFKEWSGDVTDSEKSMSITMDSDKSIQANFELNVLDEIWERVKRTPCFIATATYGSPNHPHVQALQDFRDKYLIPNKLGRRFVSIYYKYSPYIAEFITKHKPLRTVVRLWLLPVVALGYSMVHFGLVLTVLLLAVTFLAPFLIVCLYRRRREKE